MEHIDIGAHLPAIIDTISEGLMLIGPDGRIKLVNPAMERLTGFTRDELLEQPCSILKCDMCDRSRSEGLRHWCRLFESRSMHRHRCHIMRKDGACVTVLKNASVLRQGDQLLAVETLTDITELVERDRKIEELSRRLAPPPGFYGMIGKSEPMRRVFATIDKAAQSEAPVIVYGESGTGKELAARAVHDAGPRRGGPYIQLNCAALNESLFESELFGHVKGAFTGAIRHRQGRFEAAHGGSIFLDEIGDVPPAIQVKLLRVLETKQIERVGDNTPITVDARIITATNKDLRKLSAEGGFREDLLYRINVIPIYMPPLRARKEDIPMLAAEFLREIAARSNGVPFELSKPALKTLMAYQWPGNVRELKSALEFATAIAEGEDTIAVEHLPDHLINAGCAQPQDYTQEYAADADRSPVQDRTNPDDPPEKKQLVEALSQAGGNKSEAARLLGVHRGTVINRMRKYGIDLKKIVTG